MPPPGAARGFRNVISLDHERRAGTAAIAPEGYAWGPPSGRGAAKALQSSINLDRKRCERREGHRCCRRRRGKRSRAGELRRPRGVQPVLITNRVNGANKGADFATVNVEGRGRGIGDGGSEWLPEYNKL